MNVKRLTVLFLSVILALAFVSAGDKASYDFTIYKTADNSVMGVKGDKLGLDLTGYGFVGTNNNNGIYFRIGLQTPFDTILGYLNIFPNKVSQADKEENPAPDNDKEMEENVTNANDATELTSPSFSENTVSLSSPPSLDSDIIPPLSNDSASSPDNTLPEISIDIPKDSISDKKQDDLPTPGDFPEFSDENKTEDNGKNSSVGTAPSTEEENEKTPIGTTNEIDSSDDGQVVKAKTKNDTFDKEWRLLLTAGPAYRSFLGDDAMVYLGYGASIDMGHRQEVERDTKNTNISTYAILGADADMGLRYTVRGRTSIRVGVHFTVSLIGVKYQSVFSSSNMEISHNLDIYGYALGKRGIFETLSGKGYVMLASAFNGKKAFTVYNYSNSTNKIGAGILVEAKND